MNPTKTVTSSIKKTLRALANYSGKNQIESYIFDEEGLSFTGKKTGAKLSLLEYLTLTDSGATRRILGQSVKSIKGQDKTNVLIAVVYLSPKNESGVDLCPWSGGCELVCLGNNTGHLRFDCSRISRTKKTLFYWLFRAQFVAQINREIKKHGAKANRLGMLAAVRINGSTDILWERKANGAIPQAHPSIQFYDYTKAPLSMRKDLPANYALTFSLDEKPNAWRNAERYLLSGHNVAAVVASEETEGKGLKRRAQIVAENLVRSGFRGWDSINGDEHDARVLDEPGKVVVLYAKGPALQDRTGFVQRFVA
jgi:predicted Rdx family selenoprotein